MFSLIIVGYLLNNSFWGSGGLEIYKWVQILILNFDFRGIIEAKIEIIS